MALIDGDYKFAEMFGKDDPRLGDIVGTGDDGDVVLVGFPYDEGVRRNGGRVGAREGPAYFSFIPKIGTIVNPEFGVDLRGIRVTDAGDINPGLSLEDAHRSLAEKIQCIINKGGIPFVVGGGNDQSFANADGLMRAVNSGNVGVVNVDAHLDVRPLKEGKVHSGSPFRLLLEDERFLKDSGRFVEFAAQGHQCSAEHWQYVQSRANTKIVPFSNNLYSNWTQAFQDTLAFLEENIFVSFDIDAISSADCPGVSAPANIGLSASEAVAICRLAGASPQVKLFDMSEYNPKIEDTRTGRLCVLMFYYFLLGVASRKQ